MKWAGGKRGLLEELHARIPKRRFKRYAEPFMGGAALFFDLAARDDRPFDEALLCDQNGDLVALYRALKRSLAKLKKRLRDYQKDYDARDDDGREALFYEVRKAKLTGDVDRGARLLFLNKTCFNGLWRVNASGEFNVPFGRYAKPRIFDREALDAASRALGCADIHEGDYRSVTKELASGDLVYFDPPYMPLTKTASFTAYAKGGFGPAEQKALRDEFAGLAKRGVACVLSNAWHPDIVELYRRFGPEQVAMPRSINSDPKKRGSVSELVVCIDPLVRAQKTAS